MLVQLTEKRSGGSLLGVARPLRGAGRMIGVCLPWSLLRIIAGEGRAAMTLFCLATACAVALLLSVGGKLPARLEEINFYQHFQVLARAAKHVLLWRCGLA